MSDNVNPLNSPAQYQYTPQSGTAGTQGQPATLPPVDATASYDQSASTSSYNGQAPANKYAGGRQGAGQADSSSAELAHRLGVPYVSDAVLKATDLQTQNSQARQQLKDLLNNADNTPEGAQKAADKAKEILEAGKYDGFSATALFLLVTIESRTQKQKDLEYIRSKSDQYTVISRKFSEYNSYMYAKQSELDQKAGPMKDKDKKNAEVTLDKDWDFSASSFDTLTTQGTYEPKNLAEGKPTKVKADGLQNRLQTLASQRDILQKEIDKWSSESQNGLQQLNNFDQTLSEVIKSIKDVFLGISRNL